MVEKLEIEHSTNYNYNICRFCLRDESYDELLPIDILHFEEMLAELYLEMVN